jgi:hypothetical protein
MNEVCVLRLTTGEDVISKVVSTDENYTVLDTPMNLVFDPNTRGCHLVPFALYAGSEQISVKTEFVVFVTEPRKDLKDTYVQSTSKIQIAPANAIV